jgi:hypothetical protein
MSKQATLGLEVHRPGRLCFCSITTFAAVTLNSLWIQGADLNTKHNHNEPNENTR